MLGKEKSFGTLCVEVGQVINVTVAVPRRNVSGWETPAGSRLKIRSNNTICAQNAEFLTLRVVTYQCTGRCSPAFMDARAQRPAQEPVCHLLVPCTNAITEVSLMIRMMRQSLPVVLEGFGPGNREDASEPPARAYSQLAVHDMAVDHIMTAIVGNSIGRRRDSPPLQVEA
jgi:hypothetical protein